MASDASSSEPGERPKDLVAAMAARIKHLSLGDRAQLRRMMLTGSPGAQGVVIGVLRGAQVPDEQWRDDAGFARWQLLAHVAAVLSGTEALDPHAPGRRLGRALFEAGYSENRLMRLTSARGSALVDQVIRAARYLAQAGKVPVDLRILRDLTDPRSAPVERARLQIARDFYGAQHAKREESQ